MRVPHGEVFGIDLSFNRLEFNIPYVITVVKLACNSPMVE